MIELAASLSFVAARRTHARSAAVVRRKTSLALLTAAEMQLGWASERVGRFDKQVALTAMGAGGWRLTRVDVAMNVS